MPNRWPGVYKRGNLWSYRAQFSEAGERYGVSGGGYLSAKEAWEARNKALDDARPLRYSERRPDGTVTLGEYLTAWLDEHTRTVRPGTALTYRHRIQAVLRTPLARKRLRSLDEQHFRRLIADLRDQSPGHATLKAKLGVLNTALNAAVRTGLIPENHLRRIKVSRTAPRFEAGVWDRDTAMSFLAHRRAAHDPLADVWHMALVTGLRRGELHGLKQTDFDLARGLLHVRRQRSQVRGDVIEAATKTASSEAPVYLDRDTCQLVAQRTWLSEYFVTDPRSDRPYTTMSTFHRDWHRAQRAAGVPKIRFHDLRHTSASFLAAAGVPLVEAQHRLRHWSPVMTRQYTHALDGMGADAAERIGSLLRVTEPTKELELT